MDHLQTSVVTIDLAEQRLAEPAYSAVCKAHIDVCSVCAAEHHFWWHFMPHSAQSV